MKTVNILKSCWTGHAGNLSKTRIPIDNLNNWIFEHINDLSTYSDSIESSMFASLGTLISGTAVVYKL